MTTLKIEHTTTGNVKHGALLLVLLLIFAQHSFGQSSSPYSRFGLGTLHSNVFSANKGMGGLTAPYANTGGNSNSYINFANPASYASLPATTFEFGANIEGANMTLRDTSYKSLNSSLNHFAIAFVPRSKHNAWAVSVGLLPYSNVNYNFTQNFNDSALGSYSQVNTGRGSLYQLYAGAAYKIKGLSIGANIGYTFGKINYEKRIELPDSLLGYNTRNIISLNAKGFFYNVGLTYQKLIYRGENSEHRKDIYLTAGLYGSTGIKLNATISSYWDRYLVSSGTIIVSDTVQYDQSRKGKINMPFNIGTGLMFGNEVFWLAGADFKYANWKDYSSPINNGGLANSWRVSVGGQIIPKSDSRKFLPHLQYRAGAYFGKSEVTYQGKGLNEFAGTFGLGVPLGKFGRLNLAGEVGSRGANTQEAVRENFYRFTFGIVLSDANWFYKIKAD